MEIAVLACCAVIIVLLIVILVRMGAKNGGDAEKIKDSVESGNRAVLDQLARQNDSVSGMIERHVGLLGDKLGSEQSGMKTSLAENLEKLYAEMTELRRENREGIESINKIVTEKMQQTLTDSNAGIVRNVSELGRNLSTEQEKQLRLTEEKLKKLEDGFDKIRMDILGALKAMNETNTENMTKLMSENRESLDRINGTVNEKLQKTLDDKITQSFETVNKRLAEVYEGLGEMKNVASGVNDLKNVLSNVKTRGIVGEFQLSAILAEILAPEQYCEQEAMIPNSPERVDFAIKLPGLENGEYVYLPIDSKFPGDTYTALVQAYEGGSADDIKDKRVKLERRIKEEARSIRDKYISPPHTTDFAIMFLPFEGLYSEVVNMGLVEVLQRDYKVNIAGPSTMAAMLNSLRMGFRTLAIQKKSGEVWKILEAVKKEFTTFEDVLTKTRNNLRLADENLDKLIGTRTNAINRKLRNVSQTDSLETAQEIIDSD